MVGVNLPVTPMQHHYLVTDDIPELAALDHEIISVTDLEGFTYLQPNRKGVLLGVYERNPRHWKVEGAEWDYGMELLPSDIDRISPELEIGFNRFPVLQNAGIRRWVNGAFTFTPDGNPLVGPVPGIKNYWVACGCMGVTGKLTPTMFPTLRAHNPAALTTCSAITEPCSVITFHFPFS